MNENQRRNCGNCGQPLSESEAAFGVRLCASCSSNQAAQAPRVEPDSFMQRGLMTVGLIGFLNGTNGLNGEPTVDVTAADAASGDGGFDAGGASFDAGGGGSD